MEFVKKVLNLQALKKPKPYGNFHQPHARASRAHEKRLSREEKRATELFNRRRITMDLSLDTTKSPAKPKTSTKQAIQTKTQPKKQMVVAIPKENKRVEMLKKWQKEKEERLKKENASKKPIFRPGGIAVMAAPNKSTTNLSTMFGLENKTTFVAPKNVKPISLTNKSSNKLPLAKEAPKKVTKAPILASRITRSQNPSTKVLPKKSPDYSQFNKNINANSTLNPIKPTVTKKIMPKIVANLKKISATKPQKRKSLLANKENQKSTTKPLLEPSKPKRRSILLEKNVEDTSTSKTGKPTLEKASSMKNDAQKNISISPRIKTRSYMNSLQNNVANTQNKIKVKSVESLVKKAPVSVKNKITKSETIPKKVSANQIKKNVPEKAPIGSKMDVLKNKKASVSKIIEETQENSEIENKDPNVPARRKSRKSLNLNKPDENLDLSVKKLTPKQKRGTIFDINTSLDEQRLKKALSPRLPKNTRKSLSAIELTKKSGPNAKKSPLVQNLSMTELGKRKRSSIKGRSSQVGLQNWDIEDVLGTEGAKGNIKASGTPRGRTPKKGASDKEVFVANNELVSPENKGAILENGYCTPVKEAEPVVYLSPFVTTSRGKSSSRKEYKARESLLINPNLDDTPEKSNKAAAKYYHQQLDSVIKRLLDLCDKWTLIKEGDKNMPEDATDMVDVAIGQTHLLINKKFKQFRGLILDCENGQGEAKVNAFDLQGFWDMVYIQVNDLDVRFNRLEAIKNNNWAEILPAPKKVAPIKKRVPPKPKPTVALNRPSVRDAIRAARQKANNKLKVPGEEDVVFNGGFFTVKSPAKNASEMKQKTPHSKRKSLLTSVLSAEAKKTLKSKLDMNQTLPTPGKSILKKSNSRKTTHLNKTVLFANEDDL